VEHKSPIGRPGLLRRIVDSPVEIETGKPGLACEEQHASS